MNRILTKYCMKSFSFLSILKYYILTNFSFCFCRSIWTHGCPPLCQTDAGVFPSLDITQPKPSAYSSAIFQGQRGWNRAMWCLLWVRRGDCPLHPPTHTLLLPNPSLHPATSVFSLKSPSQKSSGRSLRRDMLRSSRKRRRRKKGSSMRRIGRKRSHAQRPPLSRARPSHSALAISLLSTMGSQLRRQMNSTSTNMLVLAYSS